MACGSYGYCVGVLVSLLCRFESDPVVRCIPKQEHPLYARIQADARCGRIYRNSAVGN